VQAPRRGKGIAVSVRWWDGYLEEFEATEVRFGCDLLWLRLTNGTNRHIPLRHVRWFSQTPESHARVAVPAPPDGMLLDGYKPDGTPVYATPWMPIADLGKSRSRGRKPKPDAPAP
jgi:hypothetical protein